MEDVWVYQLMVMILMVLVHNKNGEAYPELPKHLK